MPPERSALPVFRFTSFTAEGLTHGITGRTAMLPLDGDVSFVTGRGSPLIRENRERWGDTIAAPACNWVCAQQVHGARAAHVGRAEAGRGSRCFDDALPATDVLLTDQADVPLAIFCADCTPILLFDPVHRAVAAAHAGWRGTVHDVAGEVVRALQRAFGTRPRDVIAGIGPAIGPCCYDVGPEVVESWRRTGIDPSGRAVVGPTHGRRFDLWEANRRCLVAADVRPERIEIAGICTRCASERFFSHRSGRVPEGRFAAVIVLDGGSIHGRA